MRGKDAQKRREDRGIESSEMMAVSQTEGRILRRSHLQAAYVIKRGLFQLTAHYTRELKAYNNNLHLTKINGQIYNC